MSEKQREQLDYIKSIIQKILLDKPAFYGSIKLNFQNGILVNSNILETVLREKEKS